MEGVRVSEAHPFMPRSWQTPVFLKWLRRTHGWIGLGGAVLGLLFSVTTLTLEHDNFGLRSDDIESQMNLELPPQATTSLDAFASYVKQHYNIRGSYAAASRNAPAELDGSYAVRWPSPGDEWIARYHAGSRSAQVTFIDRSFIETLNALHTASGLPMFWKIFSDAFAGALIVLSLTGLMLWSRLHGGRLLAIGLVGVVTMISLYTMLHAA